MSWEALDEEIARWRDAGRTVDFWWRDDDAVALSSPVQQLLKLSSTSGVPLALAVIPLGAAPALFEELRASVLLHGTDHRNRAAAGEKKTEFPSYEPDTEALARLAARMCRDWRAKVSKSPACAGGQSGTGTHPAALIANKARMKSLTSGTTSATRSPSAAPRARSAPAMCSASLRSAL